MTDATIRAVNGLTARWAQTVRDGTVFSALGVWALLAFLADGATGAAREELADAVGLPAGQAAPAARKLLDRLDSLPGLSAAVGLWTAAAVRLREEWTAGLPEGARGVLGPDVEATRCDLDAWTARRTDGLIERMPVRLDEATVLLLASALAVRTDWQRPFTERPLRPESGPWQDRTLNGLHRRSVRLDRIGVAATPEGCVTALRVLGDNGIDVHLLLGEERMAPGQVLQAGVDVLERRCEIVPGSRLPYGDAGPGLRIEQEPCTTPQPSVLDVKTVAYDITADHDLLARPELFGLTTAGDTSRGHFPGVSDFPLAVQSGRQSTLARFGPLGFRAASVTAVPMAAGSRPDHRHRTTVLRARFDRPFGFLAVQRETGLVLVTGWVTEPTPYGRS